MLRRAPSVYSPLVPCQPVIADDNIRCWGTFRNFFSLLSRLAFFFFFFLRFFFSFFVTCIINSTSLSIYSSSASTTQHSTAKRNHACKMQQTKYAPVKVQIKRSMYVPVYTCMGGPGCFPGAWSSLHVQVACLHLKCWDNLLHLSFRSVLVSERMVPPATHRPLGQAPLYTLWYLSYTE